MNNTPDIDLAPQVTDKSNMANKRATQAKDDNARLPEINGSLEPVSKKRNYFGLSLLHWLYLFSLWVATVMTVVLSQNVSQFEEHGPIAFQDGFPGELDLWGRRGGWDNIEFNSDAIVVNRVVESPGFAYRTFNLKASDNRDLEKLRVTGSVKTLTEKADDDISDGGAVMVWLQNNTDEVVTYLNIGKLDGKEESYEVSRLINLSKNITRFSLVLTNKKSSAEFALTNATVELLTEQPVFSYVRFAVFFIWAILLAIALHYLFKRASLAMFAVVSAAILFTVAGVLMPETLDSKTIKPLYEKLQNVTGLTGDTLLEHAYKVGHFLFFFVISLMLLIYRKTLQLPIWEIFLLMILFAFATEGMQLYLSDRTSRISDLIIDISAVIVAAMFALMIVSLKQKSTSQPT